MTWQVLTPVAAVAVLLGSLAADAAQSPLARHPAASGGRVDSSPPSSSSVSPEATGGPDSYGYTFADQASGCAYQFLDISGTGSFVVSGNAAAGPVSLQQSFNLYGLDVSTLSMAVDGYVTTDLNDDGADPSNDCPVPAVPSFPTGTAGRRLYVLHDNLITAGGTSAAFSEFFANCPRPQGPAQACTVLMWNDISHFDGGLGGPWDMEAILYHTTGDIVFQYAAGNPEAGEGSTTGLQSNPTAANFTGLTYACNVLNSVPANTAVCFTLPTGPNLSLSLTASTEPVQPFQVFDYFLEVTNQGPGGQSGVVVTTDLPAGLTYLSNSCGATLGGTTLTWNAGSLAQGATASCTVTVQLQVCGAVTTTANVTSSIPDNPGNNSDSITTNGTSQLVSDGSFEEVQPPADNPSWVETSTNFSSPLCLFALCGDGGATVGPRSGQVFAWFGGAEAVEEGTLSQAITIPEGITSELTFYLWNGQSSGTGNDFLEVSVDGDVLFQAFEGSPTYTGGFAPVVIDLSAYADGGVHTLLLRGVQTTAATTNFTVDDITLFSCQGAPSVAPAIPTLDGIGLGLLAGALALLAIFFTRRRRRLV